ncbi:hypothetical protein Tco_0626789 [Tanacetum coccineum]|uniref:Uncharacterized protein n=1 Tax=Tanacetum coccineum TaxID=301880 RepID=A0ABQ4WKN7_9ASTR
MEQRYSQEDIILSDSEIAYGAFGQAFLEKYKGTMRRIAKGRRNTGRPLQPTAKSGLLDVARTEVALAVLYLTKAEPGTRYAKPYNTDQNSRAMARQGQRKTLTKKTHGLRVGQESAMKAIGVALAYVLRTAPLGQLESDLNVHIQSILYSLRFRISPESSGRVHVLFKYRVISAVTVQFLHQVEFFEGWKPLSPLQLVVEEVISE